MGAWPKIGLMLISLYVAQVYAASQAYTDGQTAATATLGSTAGSVTQDTVTSVGQPFAGNTNTLQSTYDASNAGNVGLFSTGQQQVADCKNLPANAPVNDKEYCDGVNALAQNPLQNARNKTGVTKNDPIFTNPNNAYNQGMLQAKTTDTSVGAGTGQNGTVGATSCITSATTTPATYTNQTCQRSAAETTQSCSKTMTPSVTTISGCNVSGTGTVAFGANFTAWFMPWAVSIMNDPTATEEFITYGCNSQGYATATISLNPLLLTYAMVLDPFTFSFTPGITTPVYSPKMLHSTDSWFTTSGWIIQVWYDGPSDRIMVAGGECWYQYGGGYSCNSTRTATPYTGSMGIRYILSDTVQNSCSAFQATTDTPTAYPATLVSGALTCPTGKTLSGTNCI